MGRMIWEGGLGRRIGKDEEEEEEEEEEGLGRRRIGNEDWEG